MAEHTIMNAYRSKVISEGTRHAPKLTRAGWAAVARDIFCGRRRLATVLKIGLIGCAVLTPSQWLMAQVFTTLHTFTAYPIVTNLDGASPNGLLLSGNVLYGTARYGGNPQAGTVFKVNANGTGFTTLHNFSGGDGSGPQGTLILANDTLYGTTSDGGSSSVGTVFAVKTDGTGFTNLHSFTGGNGGAQPWAGLVLSGNTLYGSAGYGGTGFVGTVFALKTDGTGFTNLHNFSYGGGIFPEGALVLSNNTLYGTTHGDGSSGYGTVFVLHTDGTGFTNLHTSYGNDGHGYRAGLVLSGDMLYGTADFGGDGPGVGLGAIFAVHTDGTGFTNLHSFTAANNGTNSDGAYPFGALVLSDNKLYGTANAGGSEGSGSVFAMNTDGTGFTNLHSFTTANYPGFVNSDGANPTAGLVFSNNTLYGTASSGGAWGQGTAFSLNTDGTGFTVLHHFTPTTAPSTNSDGAGPFVGLITNSSGNILYGTAPYGGSTGNGTVFAVHTDGTGFTTLHDFTARSGLFQINSDGAGPSGGLVLSGNTLFGTAYQGGDSGNGTVFAVSTDGLSFATLHHFSAPPPCCATNEDGYHPSAGLVLSGNTLYGTAQSGGSFGVGAVFAVNTDGLGFTNLHSFNLGSDGGNLLAGLLLSGNTLYGTAYNGGSNYNGTVFALHTDGTGFTNLHSFTGGSDGGYPQAGLLLSGNALFGITSLGGDWGNGTVFALHTDGTGFTHLHSFSAADPTYYTNSDGYNPRGLVLSGGILYGAAYGGNAGNGTVFALGTNGTGFNVLYNLADGHFDGYKYVNSDGASPGGLMLSGNSLYGTATAGGDSGNGTIFSLSFRPRLTIAHAGPNVVLAWPTNVAGFDYSGYRLQATTNLGSTTFWTTNLPGPVTGNGQNVVTNPITATGQLFRLSQ